MAVGGDWNVSITWRVAAPWIVRLGSASRRDGGTTLRGGVRRAMHGLSAFERTLGARRDPNAHVVKIGSQALDFRRNGLTEDPSSSKC